VRLKVVYTRRAVRDLSRLDSRIGDYRVIFDVEGDELVVLRVGHRREIYRG